MIKNNSLKLFLLGAAILFWELALIRWLGSSIRIVAYYSNFVLIAAFLGLGVGAISGRYKISIQRLILPLLILCILIGPLLGNFFSANPDTADEFVWVGTPAGISARSFISGSLIVLPYWLALLGVFIPVVLLFAGFGRWLADLFKKLTPLKAYSTEIGGSLLGIGLFALMSYVQTPPLFWFIAGLTILVPILEIKLRDYVMAGFALVLVLVGVAQETSHLIWSPYYKIQIAQLQQIYDLKTKKPVDISQYPTYAITVNNDYHQLAMDLNVRTEEHNFFKSWRWLYDLPYQNKNVPDGPILVVGAGTGNDVSAALRNTRDTLVYAVEIDSAIINLGRQYHPERPYDNPRVRIVNDDARSFFTETQTKYSRVVFGFLDSHTLMSSFSSVRLDNFVYTKESMEQVKNLLLPGGEVYLTFASNKPWIHQRLINLLDSVFDRQTTFELDKINLYANGVIYKNGKSVENNEALAQKTASNPEIRIPTDNWPFLYMKDPVIPQHYQIFMILIAILGIGSFSLLKKEERKLRQTYFFMGAGFFLIETSNVISLSLLYGSTWVVNITVFASILSLILLGNWVCHVTSKPRYNILFSGLLASVFISYLVPPVALLSFNLNFIQGILAGLVFLGPVFFAAVIFGHLIKKEDNLPQAYGSNLLGATIGGSLEYFSLVMGIKPLLLITLIFYAAAWINLRLSSRN